MSNSLIKDILNHVLNSEEPVAPKHPFTHELHGDRREDPYYWMNQRENPEVRTYLEQENKYLDTVFEPAAELRSQLYQEMFSRIKQDDNTVPYEYQGYTYYQRYETGKEYAIYCRKNLDQPDIEEIMLDVNELAADQAYCHVIPPVVSPDNLKIVYGLDLSGRNLHTAYVKDLQTNQIIEKDSPVVAGGFVWTPDNRGYFYETKDLETLRSDKVFLHLLGNNFAEDHLVYHETDETSYAHLGTSKDRKYLFIHSGYTEIVECHFLELADYHSKPKLIKKREPGFYYSADYHSGYFYILTNDGAENFKLMRAEEDHPYYAHWETWIAHDPEVLLQDIHLFDRFLVIQQRSSGLNQIRIKPWNNDQAEHIVKFRDESYDCWLGPNKQKETKTLRIVYSSLTTPLSSYTYDPEQRTLSLLKEQEVLGTFNKEDYCSEYLQVPVRDGSLVPLSLVYAKGFKKDGQSPLLLNAYGSYGICYDPVFSSNALSLLDRGFVMAIAHVRGGKEKTWSWYEQGKMAHKVNTFYDYIDCAEYLIKNRYTSNERLFARGGSAGGLLMGVIYNWRPDLFKGVLAHVPFVDVLTTMSDPTIPLTTGEYSEWGNPAIKEQYDIMRTYSPYDNVEKKNYGHLLVTTGFSDSQVQYWEPAKWVAKLRECRIDQNKLLLFYTNLDAGHGGASGRFSRLKEIALEYAFMIVLASENSPVRESE